MEEVGREVEGRVFFYINFLEKNLRKELMVFNYIVFYRRYLEIGGVRCNGMSNIYFKLCFCYL